MFGNITEDIRKFVKAVEEEGLLRAVDKSATYMAKRTKKAVHKCFIIPYKIPSYHEETRKDNDYRWTFIKPHVKSLNTCLDIGCASGYFSKKIAQEGLLTLGIDDLSHSSLRLENAWSNQGVKQNLGFANWSVGPNNVTELPSFDVILAMTVYHHFVKAFGKKKADYVVKKLGGKSKLLVLEMPGWIWTGRSLTLQAVPYNEEKQIKLKNHEGLSSYGVQIRPKLHKYLKPGMYDVKVSADDYKDSQPLCVEVNAEQPIDKRPRIKFKDG